MGEWQEGGAARRPGNREFGSGSMRVLRKLNGRKGRMLAIAVSVFAILYGVVRVIADQMNYENYWGGVVFAPFTIVFGLLFLYIALFRHDRLGTSWRDKRGRRIRFPADEHRKW